jgi:hypothetical protein
LRLSFSALISFSLIAELFKIFGVSTISSLIIVGAETLVTAGVEVCSVLSWR